VPHPPKQAHRGRLRTALTHSSQQGLRLCVGRPWNGDFQVNKLLEIISGVFSSLCAGAGVRVAVSLLQNYASASQTLLYYVFDVMILEGRDVMSEPLTTRRELLKARVLPMLAEPIRESSILEAGLGDLIQAVKAQGLEGIVAKRRDSRYEPGQRSGAWQRMRINQGQEFVIGGYTPGPHGLDAVIFGYYDQSGRLLYAGRTRNGFTPASRQQLFRRFQGVETPFCPFVNLPEKTANRWGQGLSAEKMLECKWVAPALVGQFEFVEWTPDAHLRHARFVALRADKRAEAVRRE